MSRIQQGSKFQRLEALIDQSCLASCGRRRPGRRRHERSASTAAGILAQVARVARLVWAERRTYLTGTIFVVVSIATALAYPQVIRLIIDEGIIGGQAERLNQLSLWMVVILLVEAAATGARDYFFGLGAERVGVRLRRLVFGTLLRQDIQFFDRRDVGEITTRLSADVPPLEYVLGEEFADSLRFTVFSVLGTALLFYTSPQLTLLTLLAVPPIVLATSVLGRRVKMLSANVQQAHAEAGGSAAEVLAGIRTVRAFSQEAAERSRYDAQLARALEFVRRKVQARALLGGVSLIAGECAALLAIWVGGHFIVAGRMTTGGLISFILYALLVARGFRNASRFTAESLRAVGATQWIFELLERTPLIPLDGGAAPGDLDGSIAFEDVRFRYPSRPDVEALRGVDLRIEPGEVVALVGKSGSGKSTLLNLILRFYDPDRRPRPGRRTRRARAESGVAAEPRRHGDAGADPVLADDRRQYRLRRRRRRRRRDRGGRGAGERRRVHRPASRRLRHAPSAIAAPSCPAASGSGSRSRAPCCDVRAS